METRGPTRCTGYPISRKQPEQCPDTSCPQRAPSHPRGPAVAQVMAQRGGVTPPHRLPAAHQQSPQNEAPKQGSLCLQAKKSTLNNISLSFVLERSRCSFTKSIQKKITKRPSDPTHAMEGSYLLTILTSAALSAFILIASSPHTRPG